MKTERTFFIIMTQVLNPTRCGADRAAPKCSEATLESFRKLSGGGFGMGAVGPRALRERRRAPAAPINAHSCSLG